MGGYVNAILQIMKDKQTARQEYARLNQQNEQETARSKQQQEQFDANLKQRQDELKQQQDNADRTFGSVDAANRAAKALHEIQMMEAQGKLANEITHGIVIPGMQTKPAANDSSGSSRQSVTLPGIPEFVIPTPQATQSKEDQAARIAQEMVLSKKRSELQLEEDVKQPGRMALRKQQDDSAAALRKQQDDAAMERAKFTAAAQRQVAFIRAAQGRQEDQSNLDPWIQGIADFTTDDKEIAMIKKDGPTIVNVAKKNGFKVPTKADRDQLIGLGTTKETLNNIDRIIEATPSRKPGSGALGALKNKTAGLGQYLDVQANDALKTIYGNIETQAPLFASAVGFNKGTTSDADAARAFSTILDTTSSKEAKIDAKASLIRLIKGKAESVLASYHPAQRESASKLYGLDTLQSITNEDLDNLQKAKKAAGIK